MMSLTMHVTSEHVQTQQTHLWASSTASETGSSTTASSPWSPLQLLRVPCADGSMMRNMMPSGLESEWQ
jgi:hypothetical protein